MNNFKKTIILGLDADSFNTGIKDAKENTEDFKEELGETKESTEEFGMSTEELSSKIAQVSAKILATTAVISGLKKGVGFLMDSTKELASTADSLKTTAEQTRLTTTEIQQLQYATSQMNTEFSDVESGIKKLTQSMDKARDGVERQQKAFAQLGVAYKNGKGELLDTSEVFFKTIDALSKVTNESERAAYATDIFGGSASKLAPLLSEGSDSIKELMEKASELGYVINGETIDAAAGFNDQLAEWDIKTQKLKETMGVILLPVLSEYLDSILNMTPATADFIEVFTTLAVCIGATVAAFKTYAGVSATLTAVNAGLTASGIAVSASFASWLAIILAIVAAIAILVGGGSLLDRLNDSMRSATASAQSVAQSGNSVKHNAGGTDYYEGGETWVGENGPELVSLPRGSRIRNASESAYAGSQTNYWNVTIDAKNVKEFNDIVRLAQNEQKSYRVGGSVI